MQEYHQYPASKVGLHYDHHQPPPWQRAVLWRMVVASTLASLLVVALNTAAFAESAPAQKMNATVQPQQDRGQQQGEQPENVGVVIVAVDEEGPAAMAGVMRGDILLSANGVAIGSAATLLDTVTKAQPGDEVEVVVQHGDETHTLTVTLSQRGDRAYLGVQVADAPVVEAVEVDAPPATEAVPGVPAQTLPGEAVTATVTLGESGTQHETIVWGHVHPDAVRCGGGEVVSATVAPFRSQARERQIDLQVIQPERPVMASVDEQRLAIALGNLLDNALKFTSCGGKVEVAVMQDAEGVKIGVSDTGIGIAAGELPHIFERFYRSPRATQAGSGLGLAIVERIVHAHGATIQVESAEGMGSRFTLCFRGNRHPA